MTKVLIGWAVGVLISLAIFAGATNPDATFYALGVIVPGIGFLIGYGLD